MRQNTEKVLKTYELFICVEVPYITNSFCKKSLKNSYTLA